MPNKVLITNFNQKFLQQSKLNSSPKSKLTARSNSAVGLMLSNYCANFVLTNLNPYASKFIHQRNLNQKRTTQPKLTYFIRAITKTLNNIRSAFKRFYFKRNLRLFVNPLIANKQVFLPSPQFKAFQARQRKHCVKLLIGSWFTRRFIGSNPCLYYSRKLSSNKHFGPHLQTYLLERIIQLSFNHLNSYVMNRTMVRKESFKPILFAERNVYYGGVQFPYTPNKHRRPWYTDISHNSPQVSKNVNQQLHKSYKQVKLFHNYRRFYSSSPLNAAKPLLFNKRPNFPTNKNVKRFRRGKRVERRIITHSPRFVKSILRLKLPQLVVQQHLFKKIRQPIRALITSRKITKNWKGLFHRQHSALYYRTNYLSWLWPYRMWNNIRYHKVQIFKLGWGSYFRPRFDKMWFTSFRKSGFIKIKKRVFFSKGRLKKISFKHKKFRRVAAQYFLNYLPVFRSDNTSQNWAIKFLAFWLYNRQRTTKVPVISTSQKLMLYGMSSKIKAQNLFFEYKLKQHAMKKKVLFGRRKKFKFLQRVHRRWWFYGAASPAVNKSVFMAPYNFIPVSDNYSKPFANHKAIYSVTAHTKALAVTRTNLFLRLFQPFVLSLKRILAKFELNNELQTDSVQFYGVRHRLIVLINLIRRLAKFGHSSHLWYSRQHRRYFSYKKFTSFKTAYDNAIEWGYKEALIRDHALYSHTLNHLRMVQAYNFFNKDLSYRLSQLINAVFYSVDIFDVDALVDVTWWKRDFNGGKIEVSNAFYDSVSTWSYNFLPKYQRNLVLRRTPPVAEVVFRTIKNRTHPAYDLSHDLQIDYIFSPSRTLYYQDGFYSSSRPSLFTTYNQLLNSILWLRSKYIVFQNLDNQKSLFFKFYKKILFMYFKLLKDFYFETQNVKYKKHYWGQRVLKYALRLDVVTGYKRQRIQPRYYSKKLGRYVQKRNFNKRYFRLYSPKIKKFFTLRTVLKRLMVCLFGHTDLDSYLDTKLYHHFFKLNTLYIYRKTIKLQFSN